MAQERSVVIVGTGIMGLLLADHLADEFDDVLCVGRAALDGDGPPSDTQRNQAWFQSGLLYQETPAVAAAVRVGGRYLAEKYRLPLLTSLGIFAFDPDRPDVIDSFNELARQVGLGSIVREVPSRRALHRLGPFFSDERRYYSVPDMPFDEASILRNARSDAEAKGAIVDYLPTGVILDRDGTSALVRFPNTARDDFRPDVVVLASGSGTPSLLRSIGADGLGLKLSRSVLLRVTDRAMPGCDLFADRVVNLSVAQHGPVVVVGGPGRVELDDETRVVTEAEQVDILTRLPEQVRKRWESRELEWTAGIKTERTGAGVGQVFAEPEETGIDNLYVSLPGKATSAGAAALAAASALRRRFEPPDGRDLPRDTTRSKPQPTKYDNRTTDSHFSETFRGHNDIADE